MAYDDTQDAIDEDARRNALIAQFRDRLAADAGPYGYNQTSTGEPAVGEVGPYDQAPNEEPSYSGPAGYEPIQTPPAPVVRPPAEPTSPPTSIDIIGRLNGLQPSRSARMEAQQAENALMRLKKDANENRVSVDIANRLAGPLQGVLDRHRQAMEETTRLQALLPAVQAMEHAALGDTLRANSETHDQAKAGRPLTFTDPNSGQVFLRKRNEWEPQTPNENALSPQAAQQLTDSGVLVRTGSGLEMPADVEARRVQAGASRPEGQVPETAPVWREQPGTPEYQNEQAYLQGSRDRRTFSPREVAAYWAPGGPVDQQRQREATGQGSGGQQLQTRNLGGGMTQIGYGINPPQDLRPIVHDLGNGWSTMWNRSLNHGRGDWGQPFHTPAGSRPERPPVTPQQVFAQLGRNERGEHLDGTPAAPPTTEQLQGAVQRAVATNEMIHDAHQDYLRSQPGGPPVFDPLPPGRQPANWTERNQQNLQAAIATAERQHRTDTSAALRQIGVALRRPGMSTGQLTAAQQQRLGDLGYYHHDFTPALDRELGRIENPPQEPVGQQGTTMRRNPVAAEVEAARGIRNLLGKYGAASDMPTVDRNAFQNYLATIRVFNWGMSEKDRADSRRAPIDPPARPGAAPRPTRPPGSPLGFGEVNMTGAT